jgi:nitrate/nitrite transport system substrate-binding protein
LCPEFGYAIQESESVKSALPQTPSASVPGDTLEKSTVDLGFIPLTDCAPLVIALEMGIFASYGLDVRLSREPSWANIRDKVCYGLLDGAQMLAGMPLSCSLGAEAIHRPMVVAMALNLNGNAITVSNALYQRLVAAEPALMANRPVSASALKALIDRDRQAGLPPLRFAMVYPSSTHNYLLRYWLASAGVDPDRDIELGVIPPPLMAECLRKGQIDGYCVGEPWNTLAVEQGIGTLIVPSCDIWNNHPEKVFGVTRAWAEAHPNTLQAIVMALIEACRWLDDEAHRKEAAAILSQPDYLDTDPDAIAAGLLGSIRLGAAATPTAIPDFHVFYRYAANFPWLSHAEWIVTQMVRWGQLRVPLDIASAVAEVYRPALYRKAAGALGLACPPEDRKIEGLHDQAWLLATATESFTLGPDRFFNGEVFEATPTRPRNLLN